MKDFIKTDFLLREVRPDGSLGEPELMTIDRAAADWTMGRRGFLGLAAVGLAALGLTGRGAGAAESGKEARRSCSEGVSAFSGGLVDVIVAPNGAGCALVASKSEGHLYKLWKLPESAVLGRWEGEGLPVFTPDGALFIYPARDASIRLVDASTGKELAALKGHASKSIQLAVSPDGAVLASASTFEKTVRLWSLAERKPLALLAGHPGDLRWLAFTPDGRRLVSAGLGDTARVWNMPGGEAGAVVRGVFPGPNLALAPDSEHLVSVDAKGRILAWSLSTGLRITEVMKIPERYGDRCTLKGAGSAFAFSPDGKSMLVYGTERGEHAVLRAYPGGEVIAILELKGLGLHQMAFMSDGRIVIIEDAYPGTISYWKLNPPGSYGSTGGLGWFQKTGESPGDAKRFALSADGSFLITANESTLGMFGLPGGEFVTCLHDLDEMYYDRKFRVVEMKDERGRPFVRAVTESETVPAGSVCTCNVVMGKKRYSVSGSGRRTYRICTCVPVK